MKKILIAYFSPGGTTERIAGEVERGLKAGRYSVDLVKITGSNTADISGYDAVGIGFPVYVYRVPFAVTDFIKRLPALNGKPFFVFMLCGSIPGKSGTDARKMLLKKGGREIGFTKYKGYVRFYGYLKKGYLFSPDNPSKEELKDAYNFGRGLVPYIKDAESYNPPPYDPGPMLLYRLERFLTIRPFVKYFYRFFYFVNKKKCSKCNICVKNCPVQCITLSEKGYPRFGSSCISCWYCETMCPAEAITSPIDWPVMKFLISFNIRFSKRDPSIKYVPAVLKKGKILKT